ncbi:hypothetical protein HYS97_02640 [Candidatus Daviesbacteria bacterium]|nr:hypothetical protein [Candidatus Daviesbacteria bacterium]
MLNRERLVGGIKRFADKITNGAVWLGEKTGIGLTKFNYPLKEKIGGYIDQAYTSRPIEPTPMLPAERIFERKLINTLIETIPLVGDVRTAIEAVKGKEWGPDGRVLGKGERFIVTPIGSFLPWIPVTPFREFIRSFNTALGRTVHDQRAAIAAPIALVAPPVTPPTP